MKSIFLILGAVFLPAHVLTAQNIFSSLGNFSDSRVLPLIAPEGASSLDFDVDILSSSDIEVLNYKVQYERQIGSYKLLLGYGNTRHQVDYTVPIGTNTDDNFVSTSADDYSLGVEKFIGENLLLSLTGQYTKGFSDHRSVWIAEFNRQRWGGFPSFREANPQSYAASVGLQWNYSASGRLGATLGYSNALIVPGVSIDGDTVLDPTGQPDVMITEEGIDTFSGSLQWEQNLNSRLKAQQTLRLSQIENREFRTQFSSEWAYALTPNIVLRLDVGATNEEPTFEAIYGGVKFIYELGTSLQFDLGWRYYEDTGEINSSNFNTAAPGVLNTEISAGVLWTQGNLAMRASVAIFDTDFDEVTNSVNEVFTNLYRDREFIAGRLAMSYSF